MRYTTIFSILVGVLLIPIGMASALETHVINIPTGAASPDAPFFWQVEETGNTDGIITIPPNDIVAWENADTAAHTVTSGTPDAGELVGSMFDSGLFSPGESFTYQFTDEGNFDYFCLIHPWMVGNVKVLAGTEDIVHILYGVGSELDEEGNGFDISYQLDRNLESAVVNTERSTVTFILAGFGQDDELVIDLPQRLITNPTAVWVDNEQITFFDSETSGDITTLTIPLGQTSEEVVIMGSAVIPEFGSITAIILVVGVISAIVASTRTQKFGIPKL